MKTVNYDYDSMDGVSNFLAANNLQDNPRLLIQVFTAFSTAEEITALQQDFQKIFSKSTLIGSSSDGNIINAKVPPVGQTTISFTQFESTELKLAFCSSTDDSFTVGKCIGQQIQDTEVKAIISFTDGINTNGEAYLNGLSAVCQNTVISGGMAGDNGLLKETFVFTLTEYTSQGAVAVGLKNPSLIASTRYNFDWQTVGKPMRITRAKDNVVYEIDHQPTSKVYEKYLGKDIAGKLPATGIEFPLVKLEQDTLIGRAVIAKGKSNSLVYAGNLREGDVVQFGIASKDSFIRDTYLTLQTIENQPVESLFVYSCMARRRFLGEQAGCELEPYQETMNVSGFYTYGEFYYSGENKSVHLLNQTLTLLALSENRESRLEFKELPTLRHCRAYENSQADTLSAVSNLAVSVSNDFAALNSMLKHEVEKKTKELVNKSLIDELTDLPNRQTLLNDLRASEDQTLIVININDFSKINGFYGLSAGDELLLKVSLKLEHNLYKLSKLLPQAKLYKLPSDEYAIITQTVDKKALLLAAEELNYTVFSDTYKILDFDILVNATWVFGQTDMSDKCLLQADMAVKEARINKQNFVFLDSSRFIESKARLEIAHKVRSALLSNRLFPVFQPIFDNKTGLIDKYECLARMQDEDGNILSPAQFIDISKMIQMYPVLSEIMIYKSFKAFAGSGLKFSINLSLEDIKSTATQTVLFDAIKHYDIAKQLTIEILENQSLDENSVVYDFIDKVKKLGVTIAIDDFGSGYANYEHLTKLKADIVKIDGSLIQQISKDAVSNSVIDSILVFAQKLNISVVAEFVSSEEIYQHVKLKGIDYSQGFHLSEPVAELPASK